LDFQNDLGWYLLYRGNARRRRVGLVQRYGQPHGFFLSPAQVIGIAPGCGSVAAATLQRVPFR
jgi:hypothetical protein